MLRRAASANPAPDHIPVKQQVAGQDSSVPSQHWHLAFATLVYTVSMALKGS